MKEGSLAKRLRLNQTRKCSISNCAKIAIATLAAFLFFLPKSSFAGENPGVYINEVMWAGSSASTADEWIELYNSSASQIDLSNWLIFDAVKNESMVKITKGIIDPGGYFLISNNAKDHKFSKSESILNIDPDFIDSSVSLSNSNFKIELINPSGETIDSSGNTGAPFEGNFENNSASMQRINYNLSGDDRDAWSSSMERKNLDLNAKEYATPKAPGKLVSDLKLQTGKVQSGQNENISFGYEVFDPNNEFTLVNVKISDPRFQKSIENSSAIGQKNFFFKPPSCYPNVEISFLDRNGAWLVRNFKVICYQLSGQIKFYEVLPHPKNIDWNKNGTADSDDEWIELVNFGKAGVSLDGWKIADASGKKFQIPSANIKSEDFYVIYKDQSSLALNDSGETLYLYDPLDRLMDKITVGSSSSKYDQSFAKWGDSWHWTISPTPFKVNEIIDPASSSNKSYNDLAESQGKNVKIEGVLKDSERLGFTIEVDKKTIFVYSADSSPNFPIGTYLTVLGRAQSGTPPFIISNSALIKVNSQNRSSKNKNSANNNSLSNEAVAESLTIIKTLKTKKTKRLKFETSPLERIVLGSSSTRPSKPFNFSYILLCFSGILSFLGVILIYDFCCRE